jgi:hypothetical protein
MDGEGRAPRSNTAARAKARLGNAQNRLAAVWDPNLRGYENGSGGRRERGRQGGFFFGEDQAPRPRRSYAGDPGDDRVRRAAIDLRPEVYSQLTQRDGRGQAVAPVSTVPTQV